MNIDTGEIRKFQDGQPIPAGFVPVKPEDMTEKQDREMRVSRHDSRSALGKLFGLNRAQRRALMRKKKV